MKENKSPIYRFIEHNPMSIKDLSKVCGVHYNTLHGIAKGENVPRRVTAAKICKATKGFLTMKDFGF